MPSQRPSAAFEPISPDFDVKPLVESTPNFEWVVRIQADMIDHQGHEAFDKLILVHCIIGGKPLVIEGYDARLDRWTFASQWLRDNCGSKVENARDLTKKTNIPLSIGHYLNNMALLTNQWTDSNYKDTDRQRMYLKDIDCPQLWRDKLSEILPPSVFYLNESSGDIGGFGAVDEADPYRPGMRKGRGIAKAGDLMSSLPTEMRAENLMCYIGHEGTYTPAHREMCASLGQNIMIDASTGSIEDGKPTKAGSSIWFMTESKDREVVSEYWLSRLGHDIEVENHFAQVNAWKNAPFKTYVVEQKPGDFILIPPLAPHQVWNRGTRTMKVAWNRTTVETLEMAMHEALPRTRMVCRDEQYKNKAIIYYTLQKYSKQMKSAEKVKQKLLAAGRHKSVNDIKVRQLEKDFRRLHNLFTGILVSESFLPKNPEKKVEKLTYDSNITCSYCRCNIFNRFLTCPNCIEQVPGGDEDTYDICLECYAMGRSCACISKLRWVEQWSWGDLVEKHELWRHQILQYEGRVTDKSPMSLKTELDRLTVLTLAQICQLELHRRPFYDIRHPAPPVVPYEKEIDDVEVDQNGKMKKKKQKKKTEKFMREHAPCHVDVHWEPRWKQAACIDCGKHYCYGGLFRAYDMKPQDILADTKWKCPSCRKICGCRNCRHKPGFKPYLPTGTILGHNTKAVADHRSVESLVDFSYSNIGWIQKAGDDNGADTRRLDRRRREAEAAKAKEDELGEDYVDDDGDVNPDDIEDGILRLAHQEGIGIPIDPALEGANTSPKGSAADSDEFCENPEGAKGAEDPSVTDVPAIDVPEGGILRDAEHAYDTIDAITYDYPDPEVGRAIAIPLEEKPAPAALPEGYAPAVHDENDDIQMIDKKRKRAKLDDGERAFNPKRSLIDKGTKQRKSLIIKLQIDPQKLVELNKMAIMARQALKGVEVPAPVISSDLQALNASEGHPQQVQKKVRRGLEHIEPEQDDDFTPSRYRDRRRVTTDDVPRPDPDADITRRQTRMHNVHYEEPDEDEFNDVLPDPADRDKKIGTTKVVRLDDVENIDSEPEDEGFSGDAEAESVRSGDGTVSKSTPKPAIVSDALVNQSSSHPSSFSSLRPVGIPKKSTLSGTKPALPSKTIAEAQANRKAKMAAIEGLDNDSDDFDDAWSEDSFMDGLSPPRQQPKVQPQAKPMVKTNLPGLVDPGRKQQQSAAPLVKTTVTSFAKVSSDAWGADSDDSDDDDNTIQTSAKGWPSINGNKASSMQAAGMKKRGRPSRRLMYL